VGGEAQRGHGEVETGHYHIPLSCNGISTRKTTGKGQGGGQNPLKGGNLFAMTRDSIAGRKNGGTTKKKGRETGNHSYRRTNFPLSRVEKVKTKFPRKKAKKKSKKTSIQIIGRGFYQRRSCQKGRFRAPKKRETLTGVTGAS